MSKIVILGDMPTIDEIKNGAFSNGASKELDRMLLQAGIRKADCVFLNVFSKCPFRNDVENWCQTKIEVAEKYGEARAQLDILHPSFDWENKYTYPALLPNNYLMPKLLTALPILKKKLEKIKPNLVIALGSIATWAVLSDTAISTIRGTLAESTLVQGLKVLPTYSHKTVLKKWKFRSIVVMDLMKAKSEQETCSIVRPSREIIICPSLLDLYEWERQQLRDNSLLSFDIETSPANKIITCIGFATSPKLAICIPLVAKENEGYSYWSKADEIIVMKWLKRILESPVRKLAQNGIYDLQYIWHCWQIQVRNLCEDTMILHHALQPEMQKSLGFLASVYTNEASWKKMLSGKENKMGIKLTLHHKYIDKYGHKGKCVKESIGNLYGTVCFEDGTAASYTKEGTMYSKQKGTKTDLEIDLGVSDE